MVYSVQIDATKISNGSHEIRVWEDGAIPNESDYVFVCVLRHISEETCEVSLAFGDMSSDSNILLGLKAMELGYRYMIFCRLKGAKVTRWAEYLHSDKIYDYYKVDLIASYERLTNG